MITTLFRPIGLAPALGIAFGLGLGYAVWMFGLGFFDTTSRYWTLPEGVIGPYVDVRLILSGLYWFLHDGWRWPLMYIAQVDPPLGDNAALFDAVPILALPTKLVSGVVGMVNPYPYWAAACFGVNGAAFAALVRGLGQRSLLAAVAAGGLGAMAPVLHLRYGHFGLSAQWTFLFALAAYWAHAAGRLGFGWAAGAMIGLSALAFGSTPYLYPMTGAVALAFILQAMLDRRLGVLRGVGLVVLLLAAAVVPLWAFGMAARGDLTVETTPFGNASMNLLAPFWPQSSAVFSATGLYLLTRGSIGAISGQYDASCFVGAGMLLLLGACVVKVRVAGPALWGGMRRHVMLVLGLAALAVWAVSNRVYLGQYLLFTYPLPEVLLKTVLVWFRFEGRFFWPALWMIMGLGVAGVFALYAPRPAAALVVAALALQWVDLSIWRGRIEALVTGVPTSGFGSMEESARVEAEVARLGRARVVPALACTVDFGTNGAISSVAGTELQLLAARQNARMDSVTKSRDSVDCAAERATPIRVLAGEGVLLALTQGDERDRREEARREYACRDVPAGLLCVPR